MKVFNEYLNSLQFQILWSYPTLLSANSVNAKDSCVGVVCINNNTYDQHIKVRKDLIHLVKDPHHLMSHRSPLI